MYDGRPTAELVKALRPVGVEKMGRQGIVEGNDDGGNAMATLSGAEFEAGEGRS